MKLFGRPRRPRMPEVMTGSPPRILTLPQMPDAIFAVGDIHGCLELYRALEAQIVEAGREIEGTKLIVLLGDLIDRGPDSAGVIDHVMQPAPEGFQRLALRGNHEEMFLAFIDDPDAARAWLDYGGDATLQSYGLTQEAQLGFNLSADKLSAHMPDAHMSFLSTLPYGLAVGDFILVHAGYDSARTLADQRPSDLLWGGPSPALRSSGPIMVHGHVVIEKPLIAEREINVDTGAYATGKLSAVCLRDGHLPHIISTL